MWGHYFSGTPTTASPTAAGAVRLPPTEPHDDMLMIGLTLLFLLLALLACLIIYFCCFAVGKTAAYDDEDDGDVVIAPLPPAPETEFGTAHVAFSPVYTNNQTNAPSWEDPEEITYSNTIQGNQNYWNGKYAPVDYILMK